MSINNTLLKYLRTEKEFNRSEIKRFVCNKLAPKASWNAEEIRNFINEVKNNFIRPIYTSPITQRTDFERKLKGLLDDVKANEDITTCSDCDTWEFFDQLRETYNGDGYVCEDCLSNYSYSEYQDTYISCGDFENESEEQEEQEGIYDYMHRVENDLGKLKMPNETHSKDLIYYGVELEVERRQSCPSDIGVLINDDILNGFAQCKSDGSLDNGFEITTTPATFGKQKENWEYFFKNKMCMESLKGWNTDTAGLHIHISRSALRLTEIGKLLVFINDETNNPFIKQIAGRESAQWAKRHPKKIADCLQSSEKYEAINMAHPNTIELRIFKSNISRNGFYRVLEFVDSLVYFCKNYTGLTGLSLHYKTYLKYLNNPEIKAQYPALTAWLIRKGYLSGRPSRKVSLQGELHENTATN